MFKKLTVLLMLVLTVVLAGCAQTEHKTGTTGSVTDVTGSGTSIVEKLDPNLKQVELTVYRVPKNGDTDLVPEKVK